MTEDKFCRDCKHLRKSWLPSFWNPYVFARCMKSGGDGNAADGLRVVSGGDHIKPDYADLSRAYGPCGMDGKLWEPKP